MLLIIDATYKTDSPSQTIWINFCTVLLWTNYLKKEKKNLNGLNLWCRYRRNLYQKLNSSKELIVMVSFAPNENTDIIFASGRHWCINLRKQYWFEFFIRRIQNSRKPCGPTLMVLMNIYSEWSIELYCSFRIWPVFCRRHTAVRVRLVLSVGFSACKEVSVRRKRRRRRWRK